jgi:hypothetical protein
MLSSTTTLEFKRPAVYIHSGILFGHRKNAILSFAETWMKLEDIQVKYDRHRLEEWLKQ